MCIVEFALLLARDGREHARFLKEVLPTALRLSKQDVRQCDGRPKRRSAVMNTSWYLL